MPVVHLAKTGQHFEAEADEIVLDAADRAGIALVFSCRSGTCRACITQVLEGCIEHDPDYVDELNIDRAEMTDGYRLLCSAFARSDAVLNR